MAGKEDDLLGRIEAEQRTIRKLLDDSSWLMKRSDQLIEAAGRKKSKESESEAEEG